MILKLLLGLFLVPFLLIESNLQKITPQNTIFTFDLHHVIFEYDYLKLFSDFFSTEQVKIVYQCLKPKVLSKIVELWISGAKSADFYFFEIAKVNPSLMKYINKLIAMENNQKPIEETVEIIKELHKKGYELHIFSNIGELSFKELSEKYPDIFRNFQKHSITKLSEPYITKPYPMAYQNYIKSIGPTKKQIIFIDDNYENIKEAKKFGINGILFKSAKELRARLKKMKVIASSVER